MSLRSLRNLASGWLVERSITGTSRDMPRLPSEVAGDLPHWFAH
ncbi:MAG TPA: hypothetical protein VF251_06930 [Pyrinomonadaceae bacterium]